MVMTWMHWFPRWTIGVRWAVCSFCMSLLKKAKATNWPRRTRCSTTARENSTWTSRSEERRVGKSVSVRVDLGGRRIIKKKTYTHNQQTAAVECSHVTCALSKHEIT